MLNNFEDFKRKYGVTEGTSYELYYNLYDNAEEGKITTLKKECIKLGFTFDKSDPNYGKHNAMFGYMCQHIQDHAKKHDYPDLTLSILTEKGKVACHPDYHMRNWGADMVTFLKYPWKDHPRVSIISLLKK